MFAGILVEVFFEAGDPLFLQGGCGKMSVSLCCFGGEDVVRCVVKVVS
jgi:hypothetical protein